MADSSNRMRFVQDNDCHWYLIPADMVKQFDEYVEIMEGDLQVPDTYPHIDFGQYRIDSPEIWSFLDPKEDYNGG